MTSPLRIFRIFLRLGCTSFGGPTAHLGYFRDEFVEKRKWFSDKQYADLVALCQFLPGPASSQVGMAIGLQRAGYLGMFLAWVGFTLPSVLLMVAFALGVAQLGDISEAGWLLGLKAAAVAVVARAVYGMTKNLVTGKIHAAIAVAALVLVLLVSHPLIQVGAIVLGIVAGLAFLRVKKEADDQPQAESGSRTFGIVCLVLFFALLFVRAPSSSAAATWCCRCWRPSRSAPGSWTTTPSSPATAPPRPCRARCSLSRPSSVRVRRA